jgi:hypothetical protein
VTKIKVLAWIHIATSGLLLAVGLFICFVIMMSADKDSRAPGMILPMFFSMAVFWLIPAFVGAVGLLFLQWWARLLMILFSLVHLLLFPIGTVLGGFALWVLFSHEAQAAFGDKIVAQQAARAAQGLPTGAMLQPGTINLIVVMAGTGAGMIVLLGAGFLISGDTAPVELMSAFYPAVGVFALCIAYGIYALIAPRFNARP